MTKYLDLVRYRNDGDEFHVLWTARRALRMLAPRSGLVAVTVEGVSERETTHGDQIEAGLLVVQARDCHDRWPCTAAPNRAASVAVADGKPSRKGGRVAWDGLPDIPDHLKGPDSQAFFMTSQLAKLAGREHTDGGAADGVWRARAVALYPGGHSRFTLEHVAAVLRVRPEPPPVVRTATDERRDAEAWVRAKLARRWLRRIEAPPRKPHA